jgi:Gram-negative bacterial TonB protein C-terminal
MIRLLSIINLLIFSIATSAQMKDYEGILEYTNVVKSKQAEISDKLMQKILGTGEKSVIYIKGGNYKLTSGLSETWHIFLDKKSYTRFNGIDTLFYQDYSTDTSVDFKILKPVEQKNIAGYVCNTLILETSEWNKHYYYAKDLYKNPAFDLDNKIERYDVYSRETSSIWLAQKVESKAFSLYTECNKVKPGPIADSVYILPDLPIKKLSLASLMKEPEFTRPGGWNKYISTNINIELASKYVKLSKKEQQAIETIMVTFRILENGTISEVAIENKGESHKKLEEEAIRIVSESPKWKPATIMGEKISFMMRQPITFAISR